MKKVICTTTINAPTEAIRAFDAMPGWHLVVAGDQKTPKDYKLERGTYISPEEQQKYDPALSNAIGWNCIQRRNFAFLWAHDMGADIIATIDDDNIPLSNWGKDLLIGRIGGEETAHYFETDEPAFDPISAAGYPQLWHRGFPLQLLRGRFRRRLHSLRPVVAQIQADFWNGDPDVDAICRLEHAPECFFDPKYFPIASNKPSPFNSQNTFLLREVLPHYFMFPGVGRMDDIWPGFYVQALGFKVIYGAASVKQKRNDHDLTRDMVGEYLGYENNLEIVTEMGANPAICFRYVPQPLITRRPEVRNFLAFDLYQKHFKL